MPSTESEVCACCTGTVAGGHAERCGAVTHLKTERTVHTALGEEWRSCDTGGECDALRHCCRCGPAVNAQ